ncbi:MAG: hypothetical protein ACHREM_18025 [Polyangiales bacterium]
MFDALERVGWMPPQLPQRKPDDHVDIAMPLIALIGGTGAGYFSRELLPAKKTLIAGLFVWGASFAISKVTMGEPHDYFGRDNAPSNLAYGVLGLVSGFGSTWAFHGLWSLMTKGRR